MNTLPHHAPERKTLRVFDGKTGKGYRRDDRIKPTVVYGMVDPRDREVFYIGFTNNLYLRFKQHMLMTGDNTRKQARIQAISDAHMLPWMLTLEVVDNDVNPREREIAWINTYIESGVELLNDEVATWAQEGA